MAESANSNKKTGFLSLPREIRDLVYGYTLICALEPIHFDSVSGFMPAEEAVQVGIILMISRSLPPLITTEARETLYKCNTITIRCEDIASLLYCRSLQRAGPTDFDPRERIRHLIIFVDGAVSNSKDLSQEDPNVGL